MSKIKGITVKLIYRKEKEKDPFGNPTYEEVEEAIENVLVAPISSDDIVNSTELEGKKEVYMIAIPKGDNHEWENQKVKFFNKTFKVFGGSIEGIETLIPLDWNKKYKVERYK